MKTCKLLLITLLSMLFILGSFSICFAEQVKIPEIFISTGSVTGGWYQIGALIAEWTNQKVEGNPITAYQVIVSRSYKDQELLNTVGPQGKHLWWFTLDAEVSGQDGAFQLKNLPAGEYLILPKLDSNIYEWPYENVILQEGQSAKKVIIAPAKQIFYGRVLYEDGTPVYVPPPWPDAKTHVTLWLYFGMGIGLGAVDKEGYFKIALEDKRVEKLKSGESYLSISIPNPNTEGSGRPVGMFPFDLLGKDKSSAGVLKVSRPDFSNQEIRSLLLMPLPKWDQFGIDLDPAELTGKRILVCFFDMNQRPSRNCINQLAKRNQELIKKELRVVAIQSSEVDEQAFDEWVKQNKIPFPVGTIEGNVEKTRFNWGVRALPWLILTNKEHLVLAEGFGVEEIDEKIKTNPTG